MYKISMPILGEEFSLSISLSNLYFAFSLMSKIETQEEHDVNLTEKISKAVISIAENGFTKIKTYIENSGVLSDPKSQFGKIWIKNILDNSDICEIQAFLIPISLLKFSLSSHLLIASTVSGQTFHIYRINPTKNANSNDQRFMLVYKLHRGMTLADISDISISKNER